MERRVGESSDVRLSVLYGLGAGLAVHVLARIAKVRNRWIRVGSAIGVGALTFTASLLRVGTGGVGGTNDPESKDEVSVDPDIREQVSRDSPGDAEPTITISVGKTRREIPLDLLTRQSEKFRVMSRSRFSEASTSKLDLEDTASNQAFLSYLTDEQHAIRRDNVIDLLFAAQDHQMDELGAACTQLLCENLDENLDEKLAVSLLPIFIDRRLDYLSVACSQHITDPEKLPAKSVEARELVRVVKSLPKEWEFIPSGQSQQKLAILTGEKLTSSLERLQEINGIVQITDLVIRDKSIRTRDALHEASGDLTFTGFGNTYPYKSEEQLKEYLGMFSKPQEGRAYISPGKTGKRCFVMRALNICKLHGISQATLYDCMPHFNSLFTISIKTDKLKNLRMPLATKVYAYRCTALTSLSAPQAKYVNASECEALESLSAPQAKYVDAFRCTALESLSAPQAEEVDASECEALTSLSAPQATKVNAYFCQALTSLSAPQAKEVDAGYCRALESLSAPQATKMIVRDCQALTSLSVPQATAVFARDCTALENLSVPQAEEVDASECEALISLSAPQAKYVNAFRCTALTSLSAPQAKEVRVFGCTALKR